MQAPPRAGVVPQPTRPMPGQTQTTIQAQNRQPTGPGPRPQTIRGPATFPIKQTIRSAAPAAQAISVPGQPELTPSMLADASAPDQKQMLGERLYPLIHGMHAEEAGKITGMLLEIDNSELLHMLEHPESLKAKVDEAVAVLQAHQAKANMTVKKE